MQVPGSPQINQLLKAETYTTQAADIRSGGALKGKAVNQQRLTFEGNQDAAHSIAYRTLGAQGTANWFTKLKIKLGLWKTISVEIGGEVHQVALSVKSLSKRLGISKQLLDKSNAQERKDLFNLANRLEAIFTASLQEYIHRTDLLNFAFEEHKIDKLAQYLEMATALNIGDLKNLGIAGDESEESLSQVRADILNFTYDGEGDEVPVYDTVGTEHLLAMKTLDNLGQTLVKIQTHAEGSFGVVRRFISTEGTSYAEKIPKDTSEDLDYEYRNLNYINRGGPQEGLQLKPFRAHSQDGKVGILGHWYDQGDLTSFTRQVGKKREGSLTAKAYKEHCRQLSSGLCDLHHKYQMRHGDLKSLNALVKTKDEGGSYRVDIADFGGVRMKAEVRQSCKLLIRDEFNRFIYGGNGDTSPERLQRCIKRAAAGIIHCNGGSQIGVHPNSYRDLSQVIEKIFTKALDDDNSLKLPQYVDEHFEEIWELELKRDVYALSIMMISHILGINEYAAKCPECTTIVLEESPFYLLYDMEFCQLEFDMDKTRESLLEKGLEEDQVNILLRGISGESQEIPSSLELRNIFSNPQ